MSTNDRGRARRPVLRAIVVIVAALIGIIIAPSFCPRPDLAAEGLPPAEPAAARLALPIFESPREDLDHDSGVKAVFVDVRRPGIAELTVVFGDEENPVFLLDRLYKVFRWARWKRLMDVETFTYQGVPATTTGTALPVEILFQGTFAGTQRWDVTIARHQDAVVPIEEFALVAGRPVVEINTWNHQFGPRTTNGDRPLARVAEYPVLRGRRSDVEDFFEEYWGRVWSRPFVVIAIFIAIGALVPLPRRR